MHTLNHLNALYFHPHKLRFTPLSGATDDELRKRGFPGHPASGSWHPTSSPVRATETAPKISKSIRDELRNDVASERVDDDEAPAQAQAVPSAEDRHG